MTPSIYALLCLAALTACGADSAPHPPAGLTLSGSVQAGATTKIN